MIFKKKTILYIKFALKVFGKYYLNEIYLGRYCSHMETATEIEILG